MRSALILVVLVGLVSLPACASVPLKQRAVVSLQSSEIFLEAAHDAERALCSPTAAATAVITHCEGPGAATFNLTDAKHQQLARLFSAAFSAQLKAAAGLRAWRAGDPVPTTLAEYKTDAEAVLIAVRTIFPQSHEITAKAQDAFNAVTKVATDLGVH